MKPYFDSFDEKLSQGLQDAANSIALPDRDQVWAEISAKLEGNSRKTGIPAFRKLAASAAILTLLLTGMFTVAGDQVLADFRFFQTIKSFFSNAGNISGVTRTGDKVPAVGNQNIAEKSGEKALCSLEEARQLLDYAIAVPGYVPASYTLSGVLIREKENSLSPVELHYVESESGNVLIVEETLINQTSSFSYNFRSNEAETSAVEVNEYDATLIYFENTGVRKLLWQTTEKYYIVSANLDEEAINEVARSLGK